jgi:hypothetical protein
LILNLNETDLTTEDTEITEKILKLKDAPLLSSLKNNSKPLLPLRALRVLRGEFPINPFRFSANPKLQPT